MEHHMNKPKIKGTRAESAVVAYLQENGFPHAERRALSGTQDRGDVAGVAENVIEVKDVARDGLPGWIDETQVEKTNAKAKYAVCWHKRRGKGSPKDWFVTMTGEQYVAILHALGYGEMLPQAGDLESRNASPDLDLNVCNGRAGLDRCNDGAAMDRRNDGSLGVAS